MTHLQQTSNIHHLCFDTFLNMVKFISQKQAQAQTWQFCHIGMY